MSVITLLITTTVPGKRGHPEVGEQRFQETASRENVREGAPFCTPNFSEPLSAGRTMFSIKTQNIHTHPTRRRVTALRAVGAGPFCFINPFLRAGWTASSWFLDPQMKPDLWYRQRRRGGGEAQLVWTHPRGLARVRGRWRKGKPGYRSGGDRKRISPRPGFSRAVTTGRQKGKQNGVDAGERPHFGPQDLRRELGTRGERQ